MNFNYSYRAFLISTLLVGSLFLLLYIVKFSNKGIAEEEIYAIEYLKEEFLLNEDIATLSLEKIKIETHKVFNEAEKFISDLENEKEELSESLEDKLTEMDDAIESSKTNKISIITSNKIDFTPNNKKDSEASIQNSNNLKSTNSYRLVDRRALYFPNPVYTCEGFGKVVLNIEVSNLGKVVKITFNKNTSTTSNGCLIESAIKYAEKTRFNTAANKPKQLGTITYVFPGQQ